MSNNSYVSIGYMNNARQNSNSCCDNQNGSAAPAEEAVTFATDGAHVYFDTCDNQQDLCVSTACEDQTAQGRILDVTATLRNVCPGRRSAVGLTLTEVDNDGAEYARGFRAISVPAHNARCYQDVQLDAVRFVLPEDRSLQRRRHLIVRTTHHYLDDGSI